MRLTSTLSLALAALVGCSPKHDPISANRMLAPDDQGAVRVWTPADDRAALDAMRSVVASEVELPSTAPYGVRWGDVPEAARIAADIVDMAIVTKRLDGDTWRFQLINVRDEECELVVDRRPPPEMVAAKAKVGSFGQRDAEADRYVEEFMRTLKLLGKKPGFGE